MQKRLYARARAVNIWLMAPLLGLAVFMTVLVSLSAPAAQAATSSYLNFQARLLTSAGAVVPDGSYNIDFKLYNADSTTGTVGTCSGACLWEETRKNSNSQGVTVINGYFSVNLGSVTAFPGTINWDQPLWLTMNIGGTTTGASPTWDGEMQNAGHSISLTALPYSFVAGQLAKTDGSGNRGTLAFNTVATNPAITLPDASGTVCLQGSGGANGCGYEGTAGTDFIRNQTTLQTANFYIQSSGLGSVAGIIEGAASQSVDIFEVQNSAATTLFRVDQNGVIGSGNTNTASTNSNDVNIRSGNAAGATSNSGNVNIDAGTATGTVGTVSLANANATTLNIAANNLAHTIHIGDGGSSAAQNITIGSATNTTSTTAINGGTGATAISLATGANGGTAGSIVIGNTSGANSQTISIGTNSTASSTANVNLGSSVAGTVAVTGPATVTGRASGTSTTLALTSGASGQTTLTATGASGQTADITDIYANANANALFSIGATGAATFRNSSNGATAFQVQNSAGAQMLNIDSTATLNIITNGGFESGVSGWTGNNATIAQSSSKQWQGNNSLQITITTAGGYAYYTYNSLAQNTQYTLSLYAKANSGTISTINLGYTYNGTATDVCTGLSISNTTWTRLSCTFTTPNTVSTNNANIYVKDTTNSDVFFADGVQLQTGSVATAFNAGGAIQFGAIVNSPIAIQNKSDSTTALQVQNASGVNLLSVDTANSKVVLGASGSGGANGTIVFDNSSGTGTVTITLAGNPTTSYNYQLPTGTVNSNQCLQSGTVSGGNVPLTFGSCGVSGTFLNKNSTDTSTFTGLGAGTYGYTFTNSTSPANSSGVLSLDNGSNTGTVLNVKGSGNAALQVQNSSGTNVLSVNTSNGTTGLGSPNSLSGQLVFNNSGDSNGITLAAPTTSASSYSIILPTSAPSAGLCLGTSATNANQLVFSSCTQISSAAISYVTKWDANGTNITTLSDSPSSVGDLLVLATFEHLNGQAVTSISGGGVTNWTKVTYAYNGLTGANQRGVELWRGVVTSTGASTITVNYSTSPGGNEIAVTEYTIGSSAGSWNVDVAGNLYNSTGTTVTYPSLTPQESNELYAGYGWVNNPPASAGSSTGFTYLSTAASNQWAYNLTTNGGTTTQPTSSQASSGQSLTVAAFIVGFSASTAIQNSTIVQQGNFNVQAATSGSVAGVLQAASSGTGDILDLKNSSGTLVDSFSSAGNVLVSPSAASTTAFQVQNSSLNLLAVDSTHNYVQIGSATTDATAVLTVLDSYNNATDPTGVAGAMYYNTSTNKFRCYENGTWTNCIGTGVNTVGTFSASSQPNGATISGSTITFGPADATNPGMVSTGNQTFVGDKILKSTSNSATAFQVQNSSSTAELTVNASSNRIQVGSSTTDATAIILVLDSYNSSTEPTEVDGAMYYNTALLAFRCGESGIWINCGGFTASATNQATDTTAGSEVALSPSAAPGQTYTIPANFCVPGRVFHLDVAVHYSASNFAQVNVRLRVDSTTGTQLDSNNMTAGGGATSMILEYTITCKTSGSSGSIMVSSVGVDTGGSGNTHFDNTTTPVTFDTTVSHTFVVTGAWSSGATSPSLVLDQYALTTSGP